MAEKKESVRHQIKLAHGHKQNGQKNPGRKASSSVIQDYPLAAIASSMVVGAIVGRVIGSRMRSRHSSLLTPLADEWHTFKNILVSAVVGGITDVARNAWPRYRQEVERLARGFIQKVEKPLEKLV